MANYKIKIGINKKTGTSAIGAKNVKRLSNASAEYVYGSQLGYRIVAKNKNGLFHLTTMSIAKKNNWKIIDRYPFRR